MTPLRSPDPICPPVALTMGDPGGISAEITASAWNTLKTGDYVFFAVAPKSFMEMLEVPVHEITDPSGASRHFSQSLPFIAFDADIEIELGKSAPANAPAVINSIEAAVTLALEGDASAVVTNPIQKSTLIAYGFQFPGHTEFLASLVSETPMPEDRTRGPVMMLASDAMRTVPVTIHQSVRDAINTLSADAIMLTARVVHDHLKFDCGIERPRLAISGLNPHAGEDGALGMEDGLIIAPAVDHLRSEGLLVEGPLSADTMFHEAARTSYDAALCMLHDQALIPAKTLSFHDAVNITLGLPIIRTSPDHGTALNIAGKSVARADSLIAAIKLAVDIAQRRAKS